MSDSTVSVESPPVRVLVVNGDEDARERVEAFLSRVQRGDYEIHWEREFDRGLDRLRATRFDVGLIDPRLGGEDAPELLRKMRDEGIETPLVLLTGRDDRRVDIERMEAIGRLAGGIAHDFNNLFTGVRGLAQLAIDELDEGHSVRADLEEINRIVDRAAALTRQLLAFSRRQLLQPRVLNLNAIVADLASTIDGLIGGNTILVTVRDPDLYPVRADAGQLEQMILDLAANAHDAMPGGGRLLLQTSNVHLTPAEAAELDDAFAPGAYVLLTVEDSGAGIAPEAIDRIFEPFFTTKSVRRGAGLGLATVYGTVKQMGGHIDVCSRPGKGTLFRIYLPAVVEESCDPVGGESRTAHEEGETVLVVEDEDAVRSLTGRILRRKGFIVLEAENGSRALDICRGHPGSIDLIVTDVIMPEMSGPEFLERARPIRPDTPALYMSGYTEDRIGQQGVLDRSTPFLEKPFTPDDLLRKVREVIGAHR